MKAFGLAVKQDGKTLHKWEGLTTPNPDNVEAAVEDYPRLGSTSEVIGAAVRNQIVNVQGHLRTFAEAEKERSGKWPTLTAMQERADEYRTSVKPRGKKAQRDADVAAIMANADTDAEAKLLAILALVA